MAKYPKGVSGNPAGKPKGALNKHTHLIKLLEPHAEALINKMVEMALLGDPVSLRLCIERLMPKKTDKSTIVMPDLNTIASKKIVPELLGSLSGKEISLSELIDLIDTFHDYFDDKKTNINMDLQLNTKDPNEAARIYAEIMKGGR